MTLKEIHQALSNGKKLTRVGLPPECFVHIVNDKLCCEEGKPCGVYFRDPEDWSVCQEHEECLL